MRNLEEDKHEIISEYVLANRRTLNQEQFLLGVLRKQGEEGNKIIGIDKRRPKELAVKYWKHKRRSLKVASA